MRNDDLEWTFADKADSFRNEIHKRFLEENEAWKKEDSLQLELAKRRSPDFIEVHPEYAELRQSFLWQIYQGSVIEISMDDGIKITLPRGFAITADVLHMFDSTEVAWSTPFIEAEIVEGEPVIVISIMVVDYWDDEMSMKWAEEKRNKEAELFRRLRSIL